MSELLPDAASCIEYLKGRALYDDKYPIHELMGMARQLKRKELMNDPNRKLERCFGILSNYISLKNLNEKMADMKATASTAKCFLAVRCDIDDVQDNVTVLRHQVETYGTDHCNGQVHDGRCRKCGTPGLVGVPDFLFSINVMSCANEPQAHNSFMVCTPGGRTFFNTGADEVHKMTESKQIMKAGSWCGYPVLIKGNVVFNPVSNTTTFFAFSFKKFPRPVVVDLEPPNTPGSAQKKRAVDEDVLGSAKRKL